MKNVTSTFIVIDKGRYASVWKGSLVLYSGKYGILEKIGEFTMLYSETPDMSECVPLDQGTQATPSDATAGAQAYGSPDASAGAQAYGSPDASAGAQAYGSPDASAGAQAYGSPDASPGAQAYGSPDASAGAQAYGPPEVHANHAQSGHTLPTLSSEGRRGRRGQTSGSG
eukprot:Em0001g2865a